MHTGLTSYSDFRADVTTSEYGVYISTFIMLVAVALVDLFWCF